jgi:phosphoheptose isomerase
MEAGLNEFIARELHKTAEVMNRLRSSAEFIATIETIATRCIEAYRTQNKVLLAGNGGSAADAQHIAGELVSRFAFDRPALPAVALTVDTSVLTAIGNDYGYGNIFERQVAALGRAALAMWFQHCYITSRTSYFGETAIVRRPSAGSTMAHSGSLYFLPSPASRFT